MNNAVFDKTMKNVRNHDMRLWRNVKANTARWHRSQNKIFIVDASFRRIWLQ